MARFASLCLGLLASTTAVSAATEGLHDLFVSTGKLFFGTATDVTYFNDAAYMKIVNDSSEFGLVVPENSLKWESTEPKQNDFTLANGDRVQALSAANKQLFRCHTLTWHSQLPTFVANGTWTRDTLTAVIQTHISHVVGHYKGQCYSWDVVNEALNEDGTLRKSVFSNTLGSDFIAISFTAAAAADPAAKLYYNDFNLESNGNKTTGAVNIVKSLQAANVRVDGLGFQAHLTVGQTPTLQTLTTVLNRFTTLGLEVAYTELDIRHTKLPAADAAVEQQAADYVTVVSACLAVPKCVGIVVWEFTDKYSWIPQTFPGTGDACLFTSNMTRKPAYSSIAALLSKGAAATGKSNSTRATGTGATRATATPSGPAVSFSDASSAARAGGFLRGRWHRRRR